ncbi:MAG TPA: N-6 DNA methylase, partial [Gammaproteobacteria bacterium]|nr:N-6 DNA methylase [Gammaproteobacteria bacterium]
RGFVKDGNKNRLRAQDIHQIVDVFNRQTEVPRFARMVPLAEIASAANDYNLNLPRYIDSSEPEDLHDLDAHLNGGIPDRDIEALDAYWQVFPTLRQTLFGASARAGYSEALIESRQVKRAILNHPEFQAFAARLATVFEGWREAHFPRLRGLKVNDLPKAIIHTLSEDLLARFSDLPLVSRYDVYQRLMDYWVAVMQDDVYLIAADGWNYAAQPRAVIDDKERKIKETPDLSIGRKKYKMDLLPPALIVVRFYAAEQAAIDALQAAQDEVTRTLEEFVEEHSGDEGLLADALTDKGKVTKGSVKDRLKALRDEPDSDEELAALTRCLELIDVETDASKAVKEAQAALDAKVLARYAKLSEAEIKSLVVEDKWFSALRAMIESEVEQLTQRLSSRVTELESRYGIALPALTRDVADLSERVELHLKRMGLAWA